MAFQFLRQVLSVVFVWLECTDQNITAYLCELTDTCLAMCPKKYDGRHSIGENRTPHSHFVRFKMDICGVILVRDCPRNGLAVSRSIRGRIRRSLCFRLDTWGKGGVERCGRQVSHLK